MSTRVNIPDLKKYPFLLDPPFFNGCLLVVLCRYMDKKLTLQLNANRRVTGVLRGFDPFMNVVLDEAVDETSQANMGLAVQYVARDGHYVAYNLARIR